MATEFRKIQKSRTGYYIILPQKMMEQTGTDLANCQMAVISYIDKNKYTIEFINPSN